MNSILARFAALPAVDGAATSLLGAMFGTRHHNRSLHSEHQKWPDQSRPIPGFPPPKIAEAGAREGGGSSPRSPGRDKLNLELKRRATTTELGGGGGGGGEGKIGGGMIGGVGGCVVASALRVCRSRLQRQKALVTTQIRDLKVSFLFIIFFLFIVPFSSLFLSLQDEIRKRRLMNKALLDKAERRAKTVPFAAKFMISLVFFARCGRGVVRSMNLLIFRIFLPIADLLPFLFSVGFGPQGDMKNLMDWTNYYQWLNEQKRENHEEIEHLKSKIVGIQTDYYASIDALANEMGRSEFSIEQIRSAFQDSPDGPTASSAAQGEEDTRALNTIAGRKTTIASWKVAQLIEDIEEMERANVALVDCAQYQVRTWATWDKWEALHKSGICIICRLIRFLGFEAGGFWTLFWRFFNSFFDGFDQTTKIAMEHLKANEQLLSTSRINKTRINNSGSSGDTKSGRESAGSGTASVQDRLRASNFLAWLNEQSRFNHEKISTLRAEVDKEKHRYITDMARLAIESVVVVGPTPPRTPIPSQTTRSSSMTGVG
jgi:hypothetical protein